MSSSSMTGGAKSKKSKSKKSKSKSSKSSGEFKVTVGSKREVWNGTAKHTSGGLYKKDLMKTKDGRIVSKKKHAAGLKAIKRLRAAGYVTKKGQFGVFKNGKKLGKQHQKKIKN